MTDTTNANTSNYQVCPNCGYCPHCGRGYYFRPYNLFAPLSSWLGQSVWICPNYSTCGTVTSLIADMSNSVPSFDVTLVGGGQ